MSELYIKGLEMPKSGMVLDVRIYSNGLVTVWDKKVGWIHYRATFVPDHGRLIDADAIKFSPSEFWGFQATDNAESAEDIVNDAPTIIPASKEEIFDDCLNG